MVESNTGYTEDGTGSRRPCWRCGSVAPPVYPDYSGQPSVVRFFDIIKSREIDVSHPSRSEEIRFFRFL